MVLNRGCITLIVLVAVVGGWGMVTDNWIHNWRCRQTVAWVATECDIIDCQIVRDAQTDAPVWGIWYRYTRGDAHYAGRDIYRGRRTTADGALARRFVAGQKSTCYVNPDRPAEAVLSMGPNPGAAERSIILPIIMVGLSLGLVYLVARGRERHKFIKSLERQGMIVHSPKPGAEEKADRGDG